MCDNISFVTGDESLIDDIKELWEELNRLHLEKSLYFKNHYRNFKFESRKEALLFNAEKGRIFIVMAYDEGVKIGYCVANVVDNTGEIDSIYVKPGYQKRRIGKALMERALDWIKSNNARKITVKVAFGNEEVCGFYSKLGFAPRLTEMQITDFSESTEDAVSRLAKFEGMYGDIIANQDKISAELEKLRNEGKTHSVKFKELMVKKLTNTNIISLFKAYDLL